MIWQSVNPVTEVGAMPIDQPRAHRPQTALVQMPIPSPARFARSRSLTVSTERGGGEYGIFDRSFPTNLKNVQPVKSSTVSRLTVAKREALNSGGSLLLESQDRPFNRQALAKTEQISNPLTGYFWVFAREDRLSPKAALSPRGQYGGAQAGGIVSYRFSGDDKAGLATFVRATTSLSVDGDEELAIGIKAKPLNNLPISLYAEQRFDPGSFGNRGTAFYVAGGTGPELVIAKTSLETYGQAGYLFSEDDSHFFDLAATLQRTILERGKYRMTMGAGGWAGGQEGLHRIDIGPRTNIHLPVGKADLRVSLDWRQRIAGNAAPDSGVAITVTSGF